MFENLRVYNLLIFIIFLSYKNRVKTSTNKFKKKDIALLIIKRSKIFIKKKKNIDRESEANSFETSTNSNKGCQ
jgi:hypothetical protein